jgi:hypothetical protein
MSNILVWKLISGEELIGDAVVEPSGADYIVVKQPATIMMQRTEQGVGIGLMPHMPYVEGDVKVYKASISSSGTPTQNMINEYNRLFGSGIQIAPASALAGLQVAS